MKTILHLIIVSALLTPSVCQGSNFFEKLFGGKRDEHHKITSAPIVPATPTIPGISITGTAEENEDEEKRIVIGTSSLRVVQMNPGRARALSFTNLSDSLRPGDYRTEQLRVRNRNRRKGRGRAKSLTALDLGNILNAGSQDLPAGDRRERRLSVLDQVIQPDFQNAYTPQGKKNPSYHPRSRHDSAVTEFLQFEHQHAHENKAGYRFHLHGQPHIPIPGEKRRRSYYPKKIFGDILSSPIIVLKKETPNLDIVILNEQCLGTYEGLELYATESAATRLLDLDQKLRSPAHTFPIEPFIKELLEETDESDEEGETEGESEDLEQEMTASLRMKRNPTFFREKRGTDYLGVTWNVKELSQMMKSEIAGQNGAYIAERLENLKGYTSCFGIDRRKIKFRGTENTPDSFSEYFKTNPEFNSEQKTSTSYTLSNKTHMEKQIYFGTIDEYGRQTVYTMKLTLNKTAFLELIAQDDINRAHKRRLSDVVGHQLWENKQ